MKGFKFQTILGTQGHWAWSFNNECSLACHIYCDTGYPCMYHLQGTMTLTPVAVRLAMGLSLRVITGYICHGSDRNSQPSARDSNALIKCTSAVVKKNPLLNTLYTFLFFFFLYFLFETYKKNSKWKSQYWCIRDDGSTQDDVLFI